MNTVSNVQTSVQIASANPAGDSVILARQEFKDTTDEHGRAVALAVFNSRISAWANHFSDRKMQRFAYVLGSRMDGGSHRQRIGQDKLAERYLKQHGRPISRTTMWRRIRELEEAGVIQVARDKQDEGGYNPGMQCRSDYLVNFGLVLVQGQVQPHDFLRGDGGGSQTETQVETQPETQVETLKHSSTTPNNSVLSLRQDRESLSPGKREEASSLDEDDDYLARVLGESSSRRKVEVTSNEAATQTPKPYCNDYYVGYSKRGQILFTKVSSRPQRDGEVRVSLSKEEAMKFWAKGVDRSSRQGYMERLAMLQGLGRELPGAFGE